MTGSGTSALESAVVNTVAPGEEVMVLVTGAFGERFAKICQAYGIKTHVSMWNGDKRWIRKP
ncbi:hypothetical protein [Planococcus sp. MB-3u-03]|uniref:hypothetical protein n=1 Tax=Planococcus sp. MB-3u-03 TaxID=2058136 RepID=UPI001E4FBDA5|nr:hypothetical protein [Planococcus sp. MB-3u-03]